MKMSEMRLVIEQKTGVPTYKMSTMELRKLFEQAGLDPNCYYQEIEMESPYIDTHRDASDARDVVGLHSHLFYELLYIESGAVRYLLGAERYLLHRGDVVLIAPGVSHRPLDLALLAEPYKRFVVWMSEEYLALVRNVYPALFPLEGYRVLCTSGTHWEFLRKIFENGVREAEQGAPQSEAMVAANTMALLVQLTRAMEAPQDRVPQAETPELIDEIVRYFEAHLAEKLALETVARQFHVSESTVSQLFRKRLNVSFYQYLTHRRLIAAKERILRGQSFEQIAEEVGFSDYSNFYRAFRREYGISPSQYKAKFL